MFTPLKYNSSLSLSIQTNIHTHTKVYIQSRVTYCCINRSVDIILTFLKNLSLVWRKKKLFQNCFVTNFRKGIDLKCQNAVFSQCTCNIFSGTAKQRGRKLLNWCLKSTMSQHSFYVKMLCFLRILWNMIICLWTSVFI